MGAANGLESVGSEGGAPAGRVGSGPSKPVGPWPGGSCVTVDRAGGAVSSGGGGGSSDSVGISDGGGLRSDVWMGGGLFPREAV